MAGLSLTRFARSNKQEFPTGNIFCVQEYTNYGKREATQARLALRDSLAGLPQPENEYEITIPELPETEVAGTCISSCCV